MGCKINWQAVSQNYNGKKISLPTYPFQRQRYWFDLHQPDREIKPVAKNNVHPLLGTVLSSPLKQTIWQSDLDPNKLSWLQEHVVNQQIIFPGTAYIEIAIALAKHKLKCDRIIIQNLSIDSPLLIGEIDNTIEVQSISTSNSESITWETYSQQSNGWQLHCTGEAYLLESESESIGKRLIDLQSEFKHHKLNVQQHYLSCQQQGVNYGRSFQGIKQLWAIKNKALGLIELPDNLDTQQYNLHPALLDACLQILFAALPTELQANTYIPIGLDKLSLQSLPNTKVWSYLELKPSHNQILLADVWLYNEAGELLAQITDLKSQIVRSKPAWHKWLYQPQWQEKPLDFLHESQLTTEVRGKREKVKGKISLPSITFTGKWLIFADSMGVANQLAEQIESLHHIVTRDAITHQPQAFADLIQQHPKLTGVIYLWSLDNTNSETEWESYLYLVQALIQSENNSSLYFATHNAQVVNEGVTAGIKNSCLWGMQKAIALEYSQLSCVGIDIDCLDNAANYIVREISESVNEQVAYRDNQRYVSRLVKYDWDLNKETSFNNLQLQIGNPGNLDSLEWQLVERHAPEDNQIEIEVKTTGLNFRDVMVALDLYPDETKFLGLECAGIVTRVGSNVTNFQRGDEVIAIADSSFSQYLVVDSLLAVAKPESMTDAAAATIPVTFLTAYYTLVYLAQLQPGERVLIHAAAGGVGLAAIQIAQQLGAEIYATASTPKWSLLESMGVNKIMNSRNLDFADEILSATDNQGVDVVLNSLSGEFIPKSISVLNSQGRFIEIGKQDIWSQGDMEQLHPGIQSAIVDLWEITQEQPELIQQLLSELLPQFTEGKLKPLPQTVYRRDRTIEAFRYMQQGKHQGKIVISGDNRTAKDKSKFQTATYRSTYLITGGMGAIGLRVAQWLIEKGVTSLVLLGRSDIKPEHQAQLQKLQDSCQVNVIKADITNTDQLTQALRQIDSKLSPLKGVIHCAGVTSDRTITKQDQQSFVEVLAPKVQGAWNLHNLTQKYELENFILFSSASSLIGSAGQVNYCAANAFLDTLASARRNMGLPGITINWSAWQNTGLAKDPKVIERLKQKGVGSIEANLGIEILEQILLHNPVQIGVMPIDWHTWQQNNFISPYYEDLTAVQDLEHLPVDSSIEQHGDLQQLMSVIPAQRETLIVTQITQQVGNILGIKDLKAIDLELGFSELGLDSLGSVELRNKLQSSYDRKLSQTIIFDYPTVRQLSVHLLSLMFDRNLAQNDHKSDRLETLANLSEEDAEAALLAELKNLDY
ncbi:MAG: SDR family NAD(P)-dependent oxidoreductase, partial [Cyanobacteria bacterium J06600_6]